MAAEKGHKKAYRVKSYEVADVRTICAYLHVSQVEFASVLGTSVDTIKSGGKRRRNPTGLAAKVLATIKDNPAVYLELANH